MARALYEIQGYTVVLDNVVFVSRMFKSDNGEGFQFNIRFSGDTLIAAKFPDRADATLQRELFIKALRG